jgi:glycosyltransferase involved in cell wall biosynthesis
MSAAHDRPSAAPQRVGPVIGVLPGLGSSLRDFERQGQLDRLLEYYFPAYLERFARVRWFTYEPEALDDFTDDRELRARVEVVAPVERVHRRARALALGRGAGRSPLRECAVARALQAPGALPAALAGTPYVATYGYSYARLAGVPFDGALRRPAQAAKRAAVTAGLRWILRRAVAAIVTSDDTERQARSLGARRLWRIPNAVDTCVFAPRVCDREYDVVFVGRLLAQKDVPTLIRAVSLLERPVRLALVGDGPERAVLEGACRRAGVDARFFGALPLGRVADVLVRSRCFVLPSSIEGMPKAFLEAMATGLACVGSDIPGHRELAAGDAALLYPYRDAVALAARLDALLGDDDLRLELGRRARSAVVARYDLRRLLRLETSLLETVAQGGAVPAAWRPPVE